MNIALISEHASPLATLGGIDSGGQNVYVAHVARQLAHDGHQVDIFTRRDSPTLLPVMSFAHNVRVIHVPAGPPSHIPKEALLPHMDAFAGHIVRQCARGTRYDVAHANFFMSGVAGLRLRDAFGTPLVITFHALGKVRRLHQGPADGFPPERIAIEETLAATADRIIAECPQDHDDLVRHYGADPQRVATVPCGYDPAEFGPGKRSLRARLGIGEDEFVLLQLGRLVPRKGIDNVVRAVAELERRHGIAARLLVVGGESDRPDPAITPEIGRLAALATRLGVHERVLFTGRRPRSALRALYNAADVFVTTPWYEPFGITPLEAMACGCPVVGSAVGGIRHTVVDTVTGYLVPPDDPVTLAERLARLRRNPELARAFGRAGMRRVRAHFSWAHVAAQLAQIYQSLRVPRPARPLERVVRI